ncbi:MAG: cytochrome b/b6 domain-containing protein [Gammaproteobacteria bacterium]|nr:cytochrome b/b6 domain-containing protein [Gammaproteobacteria bacterium]
MALFDTTRPKGRREGSVFARPMAGVLLFQFLVLASSLFFIVEPVFAEKAVIQGDDRKCVMCHRRLSFKEPPAPGEERKVHIAIDEYIQADHVELRCQSCHSDIQRVPHRQDIPHTVDCVSCHRRHPEFMMRDGEGESVLESGQPLSTVATCGHCHDTDFIVANSDHADSGASHLYENGRPHPWVAGPGFYGGWDAIRYPSDFLDESGNVDPAAWLKVLGEHHPGGGPVNELVEMNCLMCHSNIEDHSARADALAAGNFAWANSLPLAERDILTKSEEGWAWNPEVFAEGGHLKVGVMGIETPDTEVCAQCHGQVSGQAGVPLSLETDPDQRPFTEKTGQIVAPHPVNASGLNMAVEESRDHPLDIHANRGIDCTNCHHSLNNPVYYRDDSENRPGHLVFDPRRLTHSQYLDRPLHRFAKGHSINGLADEAGEDSLRRCDSCHDGSAGHDWLPYHEAHFSALACETCHIPQVFGPALQAIDWTIVDADGEPIRQYRGIEGDPAVEGALIEGYTPVVLPRRFDEGDFRLAPFNAVASWFWLTGEPARPVSRVELAEALLVEDGHHPDLIAELDVDGDGALTGSELHLDTEDEQKVVRARLAASGLEPLTVETDLTPYSINHNVVTGEWAIRECRSCHEKDSMLLAAFPVTSYLPGGQLPTSDGYIDVDAKGELVASGDGGLVGVPDVSQSGFYVVGMNSVWWVDIAGLLMFFGVLAGVSLHALGRYIAHKRGNVAHPELKRVYMYDTYDRLWHWLQAGAITLLILTGLVIHKPHLFGFVSFPWVIDIHNILGFVLIINAALALFYTVASGTIKRFFPDPRGLVGRILAQQAYYTKGIFKGELHPLQKTKENRLNPLQQLTYLAIINVLLPVQVITGIMLYWGIQEWPIFFSSLGGLPVLAPVHTFVAWAFAAFVVMHVYLTTAGGHTPMAGIKSMVTGWDDVEVRPEPATQPEQD